MTNAIETTEDTITYDVFSNCTGQLYLGTDETLADAAWDRMIAYIESDEQLEAIRVRYIANGVVLHTYESITYRSQYAD